jgi:hypothetical protein
MTRNDTLAKKDNKDTPVVDKTIHNRKIKPVKIDSRIPVKSGVAQLCYSCIVTYIYKKSQHS